MTQPTQPAHTAGCASTACNFPGHPGPAGHINACHLCPASPTYWRNQPVSKPDTTPTPTAVPATVEREQPTGLDWSKHTAGDPQPCRICGKPALMRDADRRPCHKTCAEQAVTTEVQP